MGLPLLAISLAGGLLQLPMIDTTTITVLGAVSIVALIGLSAFFSSS